MPSDDSCSESGVFLLNRMFELRECDSLLMTNMSDSISVHDGSLDRSNTSSVSEDQELDTHITHGARFTFPPGYFACPLQKKLWFEIHPRLRLPRGSGRDPLAIGCDALRMSLERFSIRNRPNTYVVKGVRWQCFVYATPHIDRDFQRIAETSSNKREKEQRAKRVEGVSRHTLWLASIMVWNIQGHRICEVLADVLQKRLDHVTLSHLIDTLAKNTQTRLDSADVQFLTTRSSVTSRRITAREERAQAKRSVFQPLPFTGKQPDSYVPIFYLLVKSPHKKGTRSTGEKLLCFATATETLPSDPLYAIIVAGIAAIELRFVTATGEMASLTTGRLNISTHQSLAPTFCTDEEREVAYREDDAYN
ncbi:hypothetical protein OSTOST_25129 [Ostertagia ostertagi]